MRSTFKTQILFTCMSMALSVGIAQGQEAIPHQSSEAVRVEGTELARLHSVMDVLKQLPGLNVSDSSIEIPGRGKSALYIDNRKITELSEFRHIAAERVQNIVLLRQPGAEYGKDVQAVIIVHLKESEAEGLSLENTVRADLTHKLANNEELRLNWKRSAWTVGGFLGWNETRQTFHKETFTNTYKNEELVDETKGLIHPHASTQTLTARLHAAYALSANQSLSASYSLKDRVKDRTIIPENPQKNTHPDIRHDMALEYNGKFKQWELTLGNNSYVDHADQTMHKTTMDSYYLRDEYYLRSYLKGVVTLGKGTVALGAEHEYKHMEVDKHDDLFEGNEFEKTYYGIHANHPDHSLAFFTSVTQQLGNWSFQAGLRHEHIYSAYQPCEDDGLMMFLRDYFVGPVTGTVPAPINSFIPELYKKGQLSTKRDFLYPSLKVAVEWGESRFSVQHTQSSVRPYLGLTRLQLKEVELMQEKILWTEKVAATTLGWQWKWVDLQAAHTHYKDPICATLSSQVSYNAPDYEATDLDLILTPHIGVWSPMVHARFHKQWFYMPLANGKDKLRKPLFTLRFNNSFNFPNEWLLLVNAKWHSKGAERNVYYYKTDLCLDASLQKEFPRQRLTLILGASNLLHGSYNDVTNYVQSFYGISEGTREHTPRMVSISLKYKIE